MKRLLFSAFLFAVALHAEEGAAAEPGMTSKWINFALLVAGLGYLLMKTLPPFFKSRTAEIQQGILEAQAIKKDAEKRAAEMDARMAALGSEIEGFRSQSQSEMAQEADRIRQETARQMGRLEQQAQAEIETAGKIARRELKAFAAKLALDLAEKRVKDRLDQSVDALLVDDFVRDLEAAKN
jgi:F-type H+-transporting ATPase subunit b